MICPICSSLMSEPVTELFALPSVASDCRPWSSGRSVRVCSGCGVMKRVTNEDFDHDVYKKYTSYPEPSGRTGKILEFVRDKIPAPREILDIGCGQGHGIKIMEDFFPDAKAYGYEPTIHKNRPFGQYDLITLFHVFEHVDDLHEMLAYIKSSLTRNGHVLIQVPYTLMWPFDLVIADHMWHFTKNSLVKLLGKAGFQVIDVSNNIIRKEITVLAYPVSEAITPPLFEETQLDPIDWLLSFKKKLDSINEPVAVYGTSVSAMWAANVLGDKVKYYLDDDLNRIGAFNGNKVYRPYSELPIVAPFPDWQLKEIKANNPLLRFL